MSKFLPWAVVAVLVALLIGGRDDGTDDREREAIKAADSLHLDLKLRLGSVRLATDSVLHTDTVFSVHTVDSLIHGERRACDAVVSACEAGKRARDARIKTLEGQAGGRLFLYGEVGGGLRNATIPVLEGEVGAALRLDRSTSLQLGVDTDRDIKLKVRRQIKLF